MPMPPVVDQADGRDTVGGGQLRFEIGHSVRGRGIKQLVSCDLLLPCKLLADQFTRDLQRNTG